jgi:hypothetical protein
MTLTFQQVEPLSNEHHDKIIAAFNRFFIDRGGQTDGGGDGGYGFGDGYGYGYGSGDGGGYGNGYGNKIPEEWQAE